MYSTENSNNNTKTWALRSILVRFAKAYVNHFLPIRNAMSSHSVYLYWMSIREEGNLGKYTGGEKLRGDETAETRDIFFSRTLVTYMSGNFKSYNRP